MRETGMTVRVVVVDDQATHHPKVIVLTTLNCATTSTGP